MASTGVNPLQAVSPVACSSGVAQALVVGDRGERRVGEPCLGDGCGSGGAWRAKADRPAVVAVAVSQRDRVRATSPEVVVASAAARSDQRRHATGLNREVLIATVLELLPLSTAAVAGSVQAPSASKCEPPT